jgi:hypothetical protein
MRRRGDFGELIGAEHNLRQPLSVPEVDKDYTAMVASGIDPAGKCHFLTNISGPEFVAMMSAVHGSDQLR